MLKWETCIALISLHMKIPMECSKSNLGDTLRVASTLLCLHVQLLYSYPRIIAKLRRYRIHTCQFTATRLSVEPTIDEDMRYYCTEHCSLVSAALLFDSSEFDWSPARIKLLPTLLRYTTVSNIDFGLGLRFKIELNSGIM